MGRLNHGLDPLLHRQTSRCDWWSKLHRPSPPSLRSNCVGTDRAATCVLAAGDWLQGPYVYALYQHYGFGRGDIGRLFIAGFGSSMVFGTIVGSLADKTCVRH